MTADHDDNDEFLAAATRALESDGASGLDTLGWWDLLSELSDVDARRAVFDAFRAQGRTLADTPALGALVAQPWVDHAGLEPGSVVAVLRRQSPTRGTVWNVVGDICERRLLFDVPRRGVGLLEPHAAVLHPVEVPGRLTVHEVVADIDGVLPLEGGATTDEAAAVRALSRYLGRVAASCEMLGAAETAVAMAVKYAGDREQFGQPIGTFQAVRHLLAWATTDCVAIEGAVGEALALMGDPPPRFGDGVKALAGRNGLRACQRSLQVFGGIGFTAEHTHHLFHSRILQLDALLGSSSELARDLGEWLRGGAQPSFPEAVLRTDA